MPIKSSQISTEFIQPVFNGNCLSIQQSIAGDNRMYLGSEGGVGCWSWSKAQNLKALVGYLPAVRRLAAEVLPDQQALP